MKQPRPRRAIASRPFLTCGAIMLVAVLALPAAMSALTEHFTKLPMDIRLPLDDFAVHRMPSFVPVEVSQEFWIEDQDIGTDESLSIPIVKVNAAGERVSREVLLHVAYYADTSGGVSHTPEVCYRQGGAVINDVRTVRVPVTGIPGRDHVPARLVDISTPGGGTLIDIYLFVSNGEFYHDRERLRFAMAWSREPRVYFAKVEAGAQYGGEVTRDEATKLAMEAIAEALPLLIEYHLPRHEDLIAPVGDVETSKRRNGDM